MSKLVLVCTRPGCPDQFTSADIELLSERLIPDNITPHPPLVIHDSHLLIGIINPVDSLPIRGSSTCMGVFFEEGAKWWEPGEVLPDGTYALFRANETTIELASDIVASRTIWYAHTNEMFIASTSQRAIVFFLKSFQPNEAVYPWMLSSGTLGPGFSWDSRIRALPPDARLVLDRMSWKTRVIEKPVQFACQYLPENKHEEHLRDALEDTLGGLKLDLEKWVLPLSGGVDSRAIFLMLRKRRGLRTVTWGLRSAMCDKTGDAFIARSLASTFGVENKYYETDVSGEAIEQILDRFIVAGEGRVDHISGYMDGFSIWKQLFESRCQGVIRGDEAFGCHAVRTVPEVHRNMGLVTLSDFADTAPIMEAFGVVEQSRPVALEQRKDESLEMWRDRLNAEFEIPTIFAALNDLKLPYVEIANPLLSRRLVQQVRLLPDHLRTEKRLFTGLVNSIGPPLEYAKSRAVAGRAAILGSDVVLNHMRDEIGSLHLREVLPEQLVDWVVDALGGKSSKRQARVRSFEKLAAKIKRRIWRHRAAMKINHNVVAFRLYIISAMTKKLTADAGALNRQRARVSSCEG